MTEEHHARHDVGEDKEFSIVRKGYDPAEVEQCLAEYDEAFRDLEEYANRLKHELHQARLTIAQLEAAEKESIDNAMLAVFAAKDRIIQGAVEKARLIEEQARNSAGLRPEPTDAEPTVSTGVAEAIETDLPVEPSQELDGDDPDEVEAHDVLHRMLREAETIRSRLDSGLAAAFDQMEQMQRDAETRAEAMLAAARLEAARLRTAAEAPADETAIAVTLTDSEAERPSRYSRNSAGLPRIGADNGASVLAKMNSLRARLREDDDDPDQEQVPSHDAAG